MSKKTRQKAMEKEAETARRAQELETLTAKRPARKPRADTGPFGNTPLRPTRAASPVKDTPLDPRRVLAVRLTGLVIAAAALGTGYVWVQSVQGDISGIVVIGLIALGIITLMGLSAAIRPENVARRARARRR
jgi:hypothetical protein